MSLEDNSVAVIGMSGRFPGADDPDTFWSNIKNGTISIRSFSEDELKSVDARLRNNVNFVNAGAKINDPDQFDAGFFNCTPREAEIMDPQQRVFLMCAWEALERATYSRHAPQTRVGVFAGASPSEYVFDLLRHPTLVETVGSPQIGLGNAVDFLATSVSYKLNLKGPSYSIQTACSSSLATVHLACESILNDECDLALAGGISISNPRRKGYLYQEEGLLSPSGKCHVFEERSAGTVFGDGAGVVVLKLLENALNDNDPILAVICGTAAGNDGADKPGFTAPSITGQSQTIRDAYANAGISPDDIGYVEAHGSGTALGDPIEIEGLSRVFNTKNSSRTVKCPIGSVKANIGHADTAAGIAGLIKTILCLKNRMIPPCADYQKPNPAIDFENSPFYANNKKMEWRSNGIPRIAGVSSFGLGGTNIHVVVKEAPEIPVNKSESLPAVLPISAKSPDVLLRMISELIPWLKQRPDINLSDLCYTYQIGKEHFDYRSGVLVHTHQDVITALKQIDSESGADITKTHDSNTVIFAFPHLQSNEHSQVIGTIWEIPENRRLINETLKGLSDELRRPVSRWLDDVMDGKTPSYHPESQASLKRILSFLQMNALAGWWISMGVTPNAVVGEGDGELVSAVITGVMTVTEALNRIVGIDTTTDQTMHLKPPKIPIVSSRSNTWCSKEQAIDPQYWQSVNDQFTSFDDGIKNLGSEQNPLFLVMRPQNPSTEKLWSTLKNSDPQLGVVSFSNPSISRNTMLETCLTLWNRGVDIHWEKLHGNRDRRRMETPTYPFDRSSYWIDYTPKASDEPLRKQNITDWFGMPIWKLSPNDEFIDEDLNAGNHYRWILFMDDQGIGQAVLEKLVVLRQIVITVLPGDQWQQRSKIEFVLDPSKQDHYQQLANALHSDIDLKTRVLHMWSTHQYDSAPPSYRERTENECQRGFYSLLWLMQSLNDTTRESLESIVIVSNNVHEISGRGTSIPERSLVLAINRVLPQEFPGIDCKHIDLDIQSEPPAIRSVAGSLISEFSKGASFEKVVAYQGRNRLIQSFEPVSPSRLTRETPVLRNKGVYLILGGLGRFSGMIAEFAAQKTNGKLILVGRSKVPPKDQWETYCDDPKSDGKLVEKIKLLMRLDRLGADYSVYRADIARQDQLESVFQQVEDAYGMINGVFHAAGIIDIDAYKEIRALTVDDCEHMFGSKVFGIPALEQVLSGRKLDFCMIASSLSPYLGGVGFAAYAASNSFLDAFVKNRLAAQHHIPWRLINWERLHLRHGYRRNDGDPASKRDLFLTDAEVIQCLEMVFDHHFPQQLIIASADLIERMKYLDRFFQRRLINENHPAAKTDSLDAGNLSKSHIESHLIGLLKDLLGVDAIQRTDSFFHLGGNSLVAIQLISRIKMMFAVQITLPQLFNSPTISQIADILLDGNSQATTPVGKPTPVVSEPEESDLSQEPSHETADRIEYSDDQPISDRFPLSFSQQRLWFLDQLQANNPFYNEPVLVFSIPGSFSFKAFKQTLHAMVDRHEILRTSFPSIDGKPYQNVDSGIDINFSFIDLSALTQEKQKIALDEVTHHELSTPFDLSQAPLFRVSLARMSDDEHLVIIEKHHIISDGWSRRIMLKELGMLYWAFSRGKTNPLPPLEYQYLDYSRRQRKQLQGENRERLLNFWKSELSTDLKELNLPLDRPRLEIERFRGDKLFDQITIKTKKELQKIARKHNATPFMTLLTVFKLLLYHYTGQEDILVGVPIANRTDINTEKLIGFLVNTLVIRSNLSGNPSFEDCLGRIKKTTLGAFEHQDLPFELLVETLQPERRLNRNPLVSVMFVFHNYASNISATPTKNQGINKILSGNNSTESKLDLALCISDIGVKGFHVQFEYNTDLFDRSTIEQMNRYFKELLKRIQSDPLQSINQLISGLVGSKRAGDFKNRLRQRQKQKN